MTINRRSFLTTLAASSLVSGCSSAGPAVMQQSPFLHGVASGDPLSDRVILWTRISPDQGLLHATSLEVKWQVFTDSAASQLVAEGSVPTGAERDYTIKVDVTGLLPGRIYYYRFASLGHESSMGRTRTLPTGDVSAINLAVASCANFPFGYFNVYDAIARHNDLDAVLQLGDYIYEYGPGEYGEQTEMRSHQPAHEAITLADYRQRHAQYKTEPALQRAHAAHPFITVWDDHESANNSWQGGAENHSTDEGEWQTRKRAAQRAYFEWMPIRAFAEEPEYRIYRSFSFGDLADLTMLDTRLIGRDEQALSKDDVDKINDPSRSILGERQTEWLSARLTRENPPLWRLIGQQLMFGQLIFEGKIASPDMWDGYPASRTGVFELLKTHDIKNVAVLSGDIHSSWALDLFPDPFKDRSKSYGVELISPSVSSPAAPTLEEAQQREKGILDALPHVKFVDLFHHGYISVSISHSQLQADWWFVDRIDSPQYSAYLGARYMVTAGTNRLRRVSA